MPKASSLEDVAALRDQLEGEGKRLVLTNGCFDLLHAGHVRYLAQARALGDALVVALNGDASVRALKGEGRPVHDESDRAEVLLALEAVDAVVVFDTERATEVIERVRPHLYAKGGDYTVDSLHPEERGALETAGTEVHILSLVPGRSTSATLRKLADSESGADRVRPRLAVLGSGAGSNFLAILEAINASRIKAEVAMVISDREDAAILAHARERGIKAIYVDPGSHPARLAPAAQKEIRDRLVAAQIDLVVLAGFLRIVKEPLLGSFENRILNVHPSLLPRHKGLVAWRQALEAGDKVAGCTVHLVNRDLDGGRILAQAEVPVLEDDRPESLHARIQFEEHRLFPETIADYWAKLASADREEGA